jgi:hypothetical protein
MTTKINKNVDHINRGRKTEPGLRKMEVILLTSSFLSDLFNALDN